MINFFARHPTAANLLMLVMLAAGLLSLGGLRRETFPDALPTEVEVSVLYPGATPEEVDRSIVQRLDEALEGVQYLKEIKSVSLSNVGSATLRMTDRGNYATFRNEIENAVDSIDDFPDDAEPPTIRKLNSRDPVLDLLVESDLTPQALKLHCEALKARLLSSPSISEVQIAGFADRVMRVELSREALLRHGLSPTDVSASIASQSLNLPAGKIEGEENTLVRVYTEKDSARELEELVVSGVRGKGEVRIEDVGRVVDEFLNEEDSISVNGVRSALLKIRKSKSEDSLRVAASTKNLIADEQANHPDRKSVV